MYPKEGLHFSDKDGRGIVRWKKRLILQKWLKYFISLIDRLSHNSELLSSIFSYLTLKCNFVINLYLANTRNNIVRNRSGVLQLQKFYSYLLKQKVQNDTRVFPRLQSTTCTVTVKCSCYTDVLIYRLCFKKKKKNYAQHFSVKCKKVKKLKQQPIFDLRGRSMMQVHLSKWLWCNLPFFFGHCNKLYNHWRSVSCFHNRISVL